MKYALCNLECGHIAALAPAHHQQLLLDIAATLNRRCLVNVWSVVFLDSASAGRVILGGPDSCDRCNLTVIATQDPSLGPTELPAGVVDMARYRS